MMEIEALQTVIIEAFHDAKRLNGFGDSGRVSYLLPLGYVDGVRDGAHIVTAEGDAFFTVVKKKGHGDKLYPQWSFFPPDSEQKTVILNRDGPLHVMVEDHCACEDPYAEAVPGHKYVGGAFRD